MRMSEAVKGYKQAIYDKSPHTQRWYNQKLAVFAEWAEEQGYSVEDMSPIRVREFLTFVRTKPNASPSRQGSPISSYTLHGYAQVVKGFLHFCTKEDVLDEGKWHKIRENVAMPRVDEKVIETFNAEQIKKLFAACEFEGDPALRVRDRAIIALLLDTGIRATELCGLDLADLHLSLGSGYIRVFGKGRKEREVGVGAKARQLVNRYITRFRRPSHGVEAVFVSRVGTRLNQDALDQMLYRLRDWSGISGVRVSAHTFRHTFACSYLRAGGNLLDLSRTLGHTKLSTTEIYLKAVGAKDVRDRHISPLDAL